jgi:nitrite reductase/ring-hydroxylating ferredoxin subunit
VKHEFHRAAKLDDICEGAVLGLIVANWPILLARVDGRVLAVIDRCTHAASELSTGRIRRGSVTCPLHGARFELLTGKCVGGAYQPLMTFEAREANGWIEVEVPSAKPGADQVPVRSRG